MSLLPSGIHYNVDESEYRADPGLNQSLLKKFGSAKSPMHFKWDQDHPPDKEPDYLKIGRYVDTCIFTPELMVGRFIVWSGSRQGCEWKNFESENKDKTILNRSEYDRCAGIIDAVDNHSDATSIIKACNKQVVVIADHPLGFRMKALVDLLPDETRCHEMMLDWAFDAKTCGDASDEGFHDQCFKIGYNLQAAYYMDALRFNGRMVKKFGLLAFESEAPFGIKIHWFDYDSDEIMAARKKYEALALRYSMCLKNNNWTGYGDDWKEIKFKPWQLNKKQNNTE